MYKLNCLPLTMSPGEVNAHIYRALGYRQQRDIPFTEQSAPVTYDESLWYKPTFEGEFCSWTPVNPPNYTASVEHALTLPYPDRRGHSELWIHLELGEQRRWIIRLRSFHPAASSTSISPQWVSSDHYVLDADEYPNLSLPLAYCHIWLAGQALVSAQIGVQPLAA